MVRTCMAVSLAAIAVSITASADVVNLGRFENSGWGTISYQGPFADFVSAERRGENIHYTVIMIDVAGLMRSIGARMLFSASTIDTGDNIYTSAPGADVDLFRFIDIDESLLTFDYEGPTSDHQNETSAQLAARVRQLDWGTGNGRPSGGKFVSLGEFGRLTATFNDPIEISRRGGGGGGPFENLVLELSEAGNLESFFVHLEVSSVPAPGALALLAIAAVAARPRRRRA